MQCCRCAGAEACRRLPRSRPGSSPCAQRTCPARGRPLAQAGSLGRAAPPAGRGHTAPAQAAGPAQAGRPPGSRAAAGRGRRTAQVRGLGAGRAHRAPAPVGRRRTARCARAAARACRTLQARQAPGPGALCRSRAPARKAAAPEAAPACHDRKDRRAAHRGRGRARLAAALAPHLYPSLLPGPWVAPCRPCRRARPAGAPSRRAGTAAAAACGAAASGRRRLRGDREAGVSAEPPAEALFHSLRLLQPSALPQPTISQVPSAHPPSAAAPHLERRPGQTEACQTAYPCPWPLLPLPAEWGSFLPCLLGTPCQQRLPCQP